MYECYDGALRACLNVNPISSEDIPSRLEAGKLIEEKWLKEKSENISKRQVPDPINTGASRRMKL